jgi:hypothetical protein
MPRTLIETSFAENYPHKSETFKEGFCKGLDAAIRALEMLAFETVEIIKDD